MTRSVPAAVRGLVAISCVASALIAGSAHAQSGTLAYTGAASCTAFTGWTWNGNQLTVACVAPPSTTTPSCDTSNPGNFGITAASATVPRGATTTLTVNRTGGCAGAYTITFSNNIAATAAGSTLSPATSVAFAAGDATSKTVTFTAGMAPGTAAVWLNGYQAAGLPAPGIAGTATITVQ